MIVYLRCLSTRRRRAVYVFARLFRCSRPCAGAARRVRDRVSQPVRAMWQQKLARVWRDPATATASCWLQRTNANAVVTRVVARVPASRVQLQARACLLLVSYGR